MKTISNTAILCVLTAMTITASNDAAAAVRVGNQSRTYADAYNQVNNYRVGTVSTEDAMDTAIANLPVRVANKTLARRIVNGDADVVSMQQLSSCAEIYPNGEFAWDKPTLGLRSGQVAQCVATVELRKFNGAPGGGDLVLARANLAAGDSVVCNISDFPADSYLEAAGTVEFPADKAPTREDVIKVMNQEQKKGAGLKIAAGAIVGGLFGNMAGKNQVGNDSMLGAGKDKLAGTAAGAAAGAALMAGNAYAGKMGGDIILSTGVNAAAGAVMGNIIAAGANSEVLRVERCTVNDQETHCLWGMLIETSTPDSNKAAFYSTTSRAAVLCDKVGTEFTNCETRELLSIVVENYPDQTIDTLTDSEFKKIANGQQIYWLDTTNGAKKITTIQPSNSDGTNESFVAVTKYKIGGKRVAALIADVKDKAFGLTNSDWKNMIKDIKDDQLYLRNNDGNAGAHPGEGYTVENFYPMSVEADDGAVINLSNKARMKGTLIGSGVGGAMGAFTAYQGANDDIDERFVAAKREYDDSLRVFYCATGKRTLGPYNSTIVIPTKVGE